MGVGRTPIFTDADYVGYCQVATANTARDGTGTVGTTLQTLATGGLVGARINMVKVVATVTTTAGMVRLFLSLDNGTTKRLVAEIPISAVTPSGTVAAFTADYFFNAGATGEPIKLPDANAILYASTHNAEAINVFASGGKY
jgi:hypothetical protein